MRCIGNKSEKCRLRCKKGKIDKVCSLPVIWNYEDTNNNDVHFSAHVLYMKKDTNNYDVHLSPRSITVGIQKDINNNHDEKIDTIIWGIFALAHNYQ